MSFHGYKEVIEENDLVILHVNFSTLIPIKVTKTTTSKKGVLMENICQTKYGGLNVFDLVGKKYGSKVKLSKGYLYVLHPTPELWTKALPHRTQILYATDIAMIILQLELKPGSVVVESGTGSGSLTHSLIRTVAPTGHVHTFDFHQQRAEKASLEFEEHGLQQFVTASHRDVCESGFGLTDTADAVFLDLPGPWKVVPHAKEALKRSGGRLCSFSPCIEQVQQTCLALQEHGFTEVATLECLIREFQVRRVSVPLFDPEFDPLQARHETVVVGELEKSKEEENGANVEVGKKRKWDKVDNAEKESKFVSGIPLTTMPGHTGYLTFATLPPQL